MLIMARIIFLDPHPHSRRDHAEYALGLIEAPNEGSTFYGCVLEPFIEQYD